MSTRTHSCVFFDDGELHLCGCGQTAMLVIEEDGSQLLVVLDAPDAFAGLSDAPVEITVVPAALVDGRVLVSA